MKPKWKKSYLTNLEFGSAVSEKSERSCLNVLDGTRIQNATAMFMDKHFQETFNKPSITLTQYQSAEPKIL